MPRTPNLKDIEEMARGAGEILREGYRARPGNEPRIRIDHKSAIDLVTEYDRRSEAYLLNEIGRRFPGDRVVTEESGVVKGSDCCQWFLDPLDGTTNFAHGIPMFAVSIGYAQDSVTRFGVVYDPLRGELFTAERGLGAFLNGKPLRVADTRELAHSLVVTGFPYDIRTNPDNNLDHYNRFSLECLAVRRMGSASLDLCYLAAGRFDGFWELRLSPWDVAAGGLIAEEAGARVTALDGSPGYLIPPYSILAAAPAIHPQMLQVINGKDNR
jgi:myo-inositol-1(or 4)-monophosphatase